jgi:ATP-dependent Clp protease ATP-binding subunit ClpA
VLFGKLRKGGTVKVTVGQKEDGTTGLLLEALPDQTPIKPKKEKASGSGKGGAKTKAEAKASAGGRKKPSSNDGAEPVSDDGVPAAERKTGSTVPKVPRKK